MTDQALQLLLPELQRINAPTVWYADENALPLVNAIAPHPELTVVTNRYDLYQAAQQQQLRAVFSDFVPADYPRKSFAKMIYRVSKEKTLVHHLFNQAAQLLEENGELIISGYKQEGIKTYADKLTKQLHAAGTLKKQGNGYYGRYSQFSAIHPLDDGAYAELQKVATESQDPDFFYSKPGQFGWQKIDKGSQLLLEQLQHLCSTLSPKPKTAVDLGCGYGWLFLNMDNYGFDHIWATDNNAAALSCAQKNAQRLNTTVTVLPSDAGNSIDTAVDLVVCNPPFHQGFAHSQALTTKFVHASSRLLKQTGQAIFVVNEFVGLEKAATGYFRQKKTLVQDQGFKVVLLTNT